MGACAVQILLIFLQKMDLLLTKTPAEDIKNSVLPMVYRALEAPSVQIQVRGRAMGSIWGLVKYTRFLKKLEAVSKIFCGLFEVSGAFRHHLLFQVEKLLIVFCLLHCCIFLAFQSPLLSAPVKAVTINAPGIVKNVTFHNISSVAEQELCLNIIPTFANLIDYPSMKNSLIPRVKSACLQTSSLAVSLRQPFSAHSYVFKLTGLLCILTLIFLC